MRVSIRQHRARRPKGLGDGFLNRSQRPKTGIMSSLGDADKDIADGASGILTKDGTGELEKKAHRGNQAGRFHTRSEHQRKTDGSSTINKALTTSFYGIKGLEDLHK